MAQGGEFGFALLTLMLSDRLADSALIQPLLAATVVSMVLSPLLIRHNGRLAELVFPRDDAGAGATTRTAARAAQRDHVIICGFGRVGQNLARVLERQGFEYVALDSDPRARRAGAARRRSGDLRRRHGDRDAGSRRARTLQRAGADVRGADGFDEDRQGGARAAAGPADPGAHAGRHEARGAAAGGRDGGRAGDAGSEPDAGVARAAAARRARCRASSRPSATSATIAMRCCGGCSVATMRGMVEDVDTRQRGAAHGGAAARRVLRRQVARGPEAGSATK